MLKKMMLMLVCFSMISLSTYAEEGAVTATQEAVATFTLQQAIDYALTNNPQLEALDIQIAMEKISIEAAKLSKTKAKSSFYTTVDLAYVKNGYTVAASEMALRLATAKKEKTINIIANSVTQSYYNYKLSKKLIDLNDNALKLAIENKNAVDKKFELGMAAEIEVSSADLTVEKMKTKKNMAQRAFLIAKEKFSIALNYEKAVDFNLIDEIETNELVTDIDADIAKSMETRYDVLALKEKLGLDQLYFDITDKVTSENTASYKKANSALIDTKYMYTNGIKLIKLGLRATYIEVQNSSDNLKLSELELDITNRQYNADKIKYEIGIITNMELTDSLNKKLASEVEFEKSKLDYKLAKEKYDYEIKTGVSEDR